MFFLYSGNSGSPIIARQTAPIFLIFVILGILIGFVLIVGILIKKYSKYLKSEKYIQKEQNRLTTKNDILKFCKIYNYDKSQIGILWEVCQIAQNKNIFYSIKSNTDVNDLFFSAYKLMKEKKLFTENKLELFFRTLFKTELIVAQTKKVLSTSQLPIDSIIFYISDEGEQYPFTVTKNIKDYFVVEIPAFLLDKPHKPKILVRSRFTFKTTDGLSYNLITRIIRYETTPENKNYLIIAHSDQLECQAQRHFKREFLQEKCNFAPLKVHKDEKDESKKYEFSEKFYEGKLSNISVGGCCIQTNLPIKDKQYISVSVPNMNINEKIVGIIRQTRRLPTGLFALHIQFLKISTKTKNQIYTFVYKYEL